MRERETERVGERYREREQGVFLSFSVTLVSLLVVYSRSLCNRELVGVAAWRKTVLYRGERERERERERETERERERERCSALT